MNKKMKIVCAWCNGKISGKGTVLSHGICDKCFAELKQAKFEFVEVLTASAGISLSGQEASPHHGNEWPDWRQESISPPG